MIYRHLAPKSIVFVLGFIIISYFCSCYNHENEINGLEYVGTWVASDSFRSDTARIIKYNENYSYIPYQDDSTILKLNKNGYLVDLEDSSFKIRFNKKTDQLILRNIFTGEDIFANRVK